MSEETNISYSQSTKVGSPESEFHTLDLYYSSQPTTEPPPIIVYIHGGAWRSGDKSEYVSFSRRLANLSGYPVAVINYRLSLKKFEEEGQPLRHPAHLQDCAAAISFLVQSASKFGFDGNRVYIVGHSAGGQLGGQLVLQPEYLQAAQSDQMPQNYLRSCIRGVIGVAGIYDIPFLLEIHPDYSSFIQQAFGNNPDIYKSASPQYSVPKPNDLPLPCYLVAQSSEDELMDRPHSERYYQHLEKYKATGLLELDFNFSGPHFEMLQTEEWIARVAKFVKDVEKHFSTN